MEVIVFTPIIFAALTLVTHATILIDGVAGRGRSLSFFRDGIRGLTFGAYKYCKCSS